MTRLRTNIAYNFIYQFLILFLPLITAPYLARVIGAEGIGAFSFSYSIATYFVYFVMLGLNNYGNRVIASCQEDEEERSRQFWSIYAMQIACFVVVGICYLLFVLFVSSNSIIAAIQGIYVLSALFDVNWFFFGMELFKLTVIRNAAVKLLTAIAVFLFVRDADGTNVYVAIMCCGYLLSQICLWPFVRKYVSFIKPTIREVLVHLKPNLVLFVPVIAVSIYNVLSKIILGYIAGEAEVGFYESAVRVSSVPVALVTAIGTVMLPRTSVLFSKGEFEQAQVHTGKTLTAVMAFTAFASFAIYLIAEPFTELFYGPGFGITAHVLAILAFTVPLLGFGNVLRTQYLIPKKRDGVFLVSALCGALVNMIVNLALIPLWGAVGSAVASLGAEVAVLAYQLVWIRKEIPLTRYAVCAAAFLFAGVSMAIAFHAIGFTSECLWIEVVGKGFIALALYVPLAALAFMTQKRLTARRRAFRVK